jgi:hypothetical protein
VGHLSQKQKHPNKRQSGLKSAFLSSRLPLKSRQEARVLELTSYSPSLLLNGLALLYLSFKFKPFGTVYRQNQTHQLAANLFPQ